MIVGLHHCFGPVSAYSDSTAFIDCHLLGTVRGLYFSMKVMPLLSQHVATNDICGDNTSSTALALSSSVSERIEAHKRSA